MGTREDDELRAHIERAEPNDMLAHAELLQAVERGLFGATDAPMHVGRYRLLATIGSGGQGSVYVAHDPDLDREVAVKLVRSDRRRDPDARARLLREALALAQLTHPNVVAVNDVGECEAGVFVVTQLVPGVTLRQWLERERSWREIVDVFAAAGQGLAAAHERGIVHRDFKPSNVLVCRSPAGIEDGGVRLLDFGLARVGSQDEPSDPSSSPTSSGPMITASGDVMGTPMYMAPEQYTGATATAAADQYAFCVALYQALWRQPPFFGETLHDLAVAKQSKWPPLRPDEPAVPRELRRLVERGLDPDPANRWPTMAMVVERLRAIAAPRSVGRIAVATLGIALVTAAGIAAMGREDTAVCDDGSEWSATWSPERRAAIAAAFAATGQPDAAAIATRVTTRVDTYVGESMAARASACEALARAADSDRRLACLERGRIVLDETLRVLENADAAMVVQADDAIADLPTTARCRRVAAIAEPDAAIARRVEELRAEVEHARALARANRYPEAIATIDATTAAANEIGYAPLVAEAALVRGAVLHATDAGADAIAELERAFVAAQSAGHDEIAFLAAVELVDLESMSDDTQGQTRWAREAEAALLRLGDDRDPLLDGELAHALAGIAEHSGDYATAVAEDRRIVERFEADLPASDPRVPRAVRSLAFVLGRAGELEEAETTGRRAVELAEAALGPDHPETARAVRTLGWVLRQRGEFDESLELARRALSAFERAFGPEHPDVATTLENVAVLHSEMGHPHEAEAAYRRVLAIHEHTVGRRDAEVARTLHNLAITLRDLDRRAEALATWREAIDIANETLGPEHFHTALFALDYGLLLAESGDVRQALAMVSHALEVVQRNAGEQNLRTMMAWATLGNVQLEGDDLPAARKSLTTALAIGSSLLGPDHVETARVRYLWGRLQSREGDHAGARATYEQVLRVLESTLGSGHTAVSEVLRQLAREHEALGDSRAAARARARADTIVDAVAATKPSG